MSLPPPPSNLLPIRIASLTVGRVLHRNHDLDFGPIAFNPGTGQPSRFSPFASAATSLVIPTLYAATSREAAAHETVFHDIEATDLAKTVRKTMLDRRVASRIETRRDLRLASLFSPDLLAWGLARRDLIDTPKTAYSETVRWAQALHRADPSLDGLIWTSRRCDPDLCVVLFGDRVDASAFIVLDSLAAASDRAVMDDLHAFSRRAGIDIVT